MTGSPESAAGPLPVYAFSVKEVAEFCWRRGDYRFSDQNLKPTARQGQAVHRFLQQRHEQQDNTYQAEVSVSGEFIRTPPHQHALDETSQQPNYVLKIRGRIDSLWQTGDGFRLEEIKTTFYHDDDLPEDQFQAHLAQARLYAALLLSMQKDLHSSDAAPLIELQVTYWHLADETGYSKAHRESKDSLLRFLAETVETFSRWLDAVDRHRRHRQQFLAALAFPFGDYRTGQKALAGACYHQARNGDTLLIHAATGIGKSISTLFGSLKAIAESRGDQIWYLTAKTSGQQAALQAVAKIQEQGAALKCLNLSNQQKSCFCAPVTTGDEGAPCQWETGFYDRKPAALAALFAENLIDLECLQTIARQHQLCPYHLAEELLPWVDVVIGDFNYVFGLTVRNAGYLERHGRRINLLVDEAHNLADRCRDNYSATFNTENLRSVKSQLPSTAAKGKRALNTLLKTIRQTEPDPADYPQALFSAIQQLKDQLETPELSQGELFSMDDTLTLKAELNQWLRLARYCEPGLGEQQGQPFSLKKQHSGLTLECNNPAVVIGDLCQGFRSRVFFSGSLLPIRHFAVQLCPPESGELEYTRRETVKHLILESPFPRDRLRILLGNLAMGYQHRDASLPVALDYMQALYRNHPGLYLVCAPSYDMLERLKEQVTARNCELPTLFQGDESNPGQTGSPSLATMEDGLAFVVLGGSFAEGVEWPPGILKGVIILGNGMPGPTARQKRLQRYYDRALGDNRFSPGIPDTPDMVQAPRSNKPGFEHAFLFPGLNRVIQTAGRIQRTDQDAGLVLLLDQRFRQRRYQQMLPSHWQYETVNSLEDLINASEAFWRARRLDAKQSQTSTYPVSY